MNSSKIKAAKYVLNRLKKAGVDDVSVSLSNGVKTQVKFVNNEIVNTSRWEASNISFFLSMNKKIVTSSIQNFNKKNIDATLKTALKFAKTCSPNEQFIKIAQGPFSYKHIPQLYDKRIENISGKAVDYVAQGIQGAIDAGAKRAGGIFELHSSKELLLTNKDVEANDKGTSIYFSLRANYDKDASGYANYVSRVLENFNPYQLGRNAGQIAKLAINPKKIKPKKYKILFDPYPFANFIDQFGSAASIHSVESGMSFLKDKLNKQVANTKLTLYDYGNMPGGLHTFPFDSEGVPSQKTLLVDKGKLQTYLHNTSTAQRYKTKTTANAGLIAPEPSNLLVEPGKKTSKQLLKDFTGLHITNTWYTRFQNYSTGDFSTVPRDGIFYYRNGKLVDSIKDIRISDNILKMLNNVENLSKERIQSSGWEVGTPVVSGSAILKNINITTSS